MKKILLILSLCSLFACNNNNKQQPASTSNKTNASTKEGAGTNVHQDTGSTTAVASVKSGETNFIQKLKGVWARAGEDNATFEIKKNTIFYPEHSASYSYTIVKDSITIRYDGFDASFQFTMNGNDKLILTGDDGVFSYHRLK